MKTAFSIRTLNLLAWCLAIPNFAYANYDGPMRFSVFWPCNGNGSFCAPQVLAEGTIEMTSATKLLAFLANRTSHPHQLPPAPTVAFDSPGGSLIGGMLLGRALRTKGLGSYLAPQYDEVDKNNSAASTVLRGGVKCASSCVLAFAGGVNRVIEPTAKIGVHQFYGMQSDAGEAATQTTVVRIAAYLSEMGVNRSLLDRASLVPASSIYWLGPTETSATRLDNSKPLESPWTVKASRSGLPVLSTAQEVSQGRTAHLFFAPAGNEIIFVLRTEFERKFIRSDRIDSFPDGEVHEITLLTEATKIKVRPVEPWVRENGEYSVTFRATGVLTRAQVLALSRAKKLRVDDDFGRAIGDISATSNLSTDGFEAGLSLLLRTR